MILRDGGIAVISILAAAALVGWLTMKITKIQDGPVEEAAESVIENQIEDLFGLDDDALHGLVDLSPSSDESA